MGDINKVKQNNLNTDSAIHRLAETETATNDNIIQILHKLIENSLSHGASDIHIEPNRNELAIRFRMDGFLNSMINLPIEMHQPLVARIKILANLKIDEYRKPQDGRLEPEGFSDISLRVSVVPTIFGEKIVLRILNDSSRDISLDSLGLAKIHKGIIKKNIEKPHGMIISSGPTGSGKTTTLYAIIQALKRDDINITTLEDPVEYTLEKVNQVQINPRIDFTFASGLRSTLRQDPDIIMVGEIRDNETAIMAANAAMTGHLVLTTIHTNNSPSAFTRLLDMGVEDFIASSTVNLSINQRLVRRVCNACAEEKSLSNTLITKILSRKDIVEVLKENHKNYEKILQDTSFRYGKGCEECRGTGYIGRIGIFEMISPDKEIRDLISSKEPAEKIKAVAESKGYRDLSYDGVNKVFHGETTFEEILNATQDMQ